jgi:DNA-binding response OmpR family regulator
MKTMGIKILLADDEPKILQLVKAYLETAEYTVLTASDGVQGFELFRNEAPDCAILDINMPGMDGLELARRMRKTSDIPIIFLTARLDEVDRVVGLELGADDYVVKPFSPRELVARVKAVLRRTARESPQNVEMKLGNEYRCGDVVVNCDKRTAYLHGTPVELTKVQFDILEVLIKAPGRVFTRAELLEAAIGSTFEGYDRTIDAHIKNLRKALGDDGNTPRYIGTVRGVGYRFLEQN